MILEKCLVFLIYFLLKNTKNQNIIAEYPDFNKLLGELFSLRIKNLYTYILIFISEIYKDNYHLLINLNKKNEKMEFFDKLKLNLTKELNSKNYQFGIYFL